MLPTTSFTLSNGVSIPQLSYGTPNKTDQQLDTAIRLGLHHLDTAQGYGNEQQTGDAIKRSGLNRKAIFLTTKISQKEARVDNDPMPLSSVRQSVLDSIERLGTQPDLLLIHNPFVPEAGKQIEFWRILEKMIDDGELTASLGVSNYRPKDLEPLLKAARYKPVVNQIEYHPYVLAHIDPLLALCQESNVLIQAYGPLTPVLRHPQGPLGPVLTRVSARLASTAGLGEMDLSAVLLLWTKQKGIIPVTSSANEERMEGLAKIARAGRDWLTDREMEEIEQIGRQVYYRFYDEHMTVDLPTPDLPRSK